MAGSPRCDVPSCGATRQRWQRLCGRCWSKLPGELRVGIEEAHHQHRHRDWQALRRRAAAFLNLPTNRPGELLARGGLGRTTPQRAFELAARLLGER
jgi:hypothetical protein